ncbi:MAG: hypothetical protein H6Q52_416 [Deltaproteobacteria bacterium]|nr:hypothetical protein [Deltaproteobacteria bacterium]
MQYLIVILDRNSVPFCSYETGGRTGGLIPIDVLQKAVNFAVRNNLSINFLYGDEPLPPEYETAIEDADHVKMVSLRHAGRYPDAVFVVDGPADKEYIHLLENNGINNVILRIGRTQIGSLASAVRGLIGKFKRLNIILKDLHGMKDEDLLLYSGQLSRVRKIMEDEYRKKNFMEINAISDRVFLTNMNNCSAGTRHMTVAPNGKFYLCPAFYYDDEENCFGSLDGALNIKNPQLLELEYAPVCQRCDAWHCKRCLYLNRKLTCELNTPSREQCVVAHLERDQSRIFIDNIGTETGLTRQVSAIPPLDYRDPFEVLSDRSLSTLEKEEHFSGLLAKPLEGVSFKDLFRQIYSIDPQIIVRLKDLNYSPVDLENEE